MSSTTHRIRRSRPSRAGRKSRFLWLTTVAVGSLAVGSPVYARDACSNPETSVNIRFAGAWPEKFRRAVLADFEAAVREHGFAVCQTDEASGIASVELSIHELPSVAISIRVRDVVTDKRLEREFDLSTLPEDSRALALAVASDELLRASWMELALQDFPQAREAMPAPIVAVVEQEVRRTAPRRGEAGPRFAFEAWGGGATLWGVRFDLGWRLDRAWSVDLGFQVLQGLEVESANGRIRSLLWGAQPSLRFEPLRAPRVRAGSTVGVRFAQLTFEGTPTDGAVGRTESDVVVTGSAGLLVRYQPVDALEFHLEGGGTVAISGAEAIDAGEAVTALDGVGGYAATGLSLLF